MSIERRRDRRYPFQMRLLLSIGRRELVAETQDVSFKGARIRTDTPLPERQLVSLRFDLPPDGDELAVMGMVARGLPEQGGMPAGAGIQFYGMDPAHRDRWNRFIHFIAAPVPAPADGSRRQHPRFAAALQVHLSTVDDLHLLYTRNVSQGGLFVGTTLDLSPGTSVKVCVTHPLTREQFPLQAIVRWRAAEPDAGVGLEFTNMSAQRREEFLEFISSDIPSQDVLCVFRDCVVHLDAADMRARDRGATQASCERRLAAAR